MDASFGLARKKTKNEISISSRHGLLLFSDQDDVDNFVNNYELKADNAAIQVRFYNCYLVWLFMKFLASLLMSLCVQVNFYMGLNKAHQ